jgi:WD40 repeat protein
MSMPAAEDDSIPESHSEPVIHLAEGDPATDPARLDAFISYRRIPEDTAFVDRLQDDLARRGKQVWVDRAKIEPAADWEVRIARGIRNAKALIFVITPESVVSRDCLYELEQAAQLHKLIVPVVLRELSRGQQLPETLSRPNWVFFSPGHDAQRALGEVAGALDEDLDWRDAHTRLAVRTKEWTDSRRDPSFLLRGSDLRAAEDWLSHASQHQKTPPTALQTEYVLASRKAAVRTQRTWRGALSAGLVIALALAAVAFVQRNDARTQARLAQSRALAAQATADLSTNPGQSLSLALSSTKINPTGPSEQALRLAMAQDRLRMVIHPGTGSATVAAWNPALAQVAVTAPHDSVALWNTATGRISQVLPLAHAAPATQLLYDRSGSRLAAVSQAGYVSVWGISANGAASPVPTSDLNARIQADVLYRIQGFGISLNGVWGGNAGEELDLFGGGLSNVLIFEPGSGVTVPLFRQPFKDGGVDSLAASPDGTKLLVVGDLINFTNRHQTLLSPQPDSVSGPYCWFPDGSAVVTSTTVSAGGPERIYNASSGTQVASMQTPVGPTSAVACSAGPSNDWVAAGDASGNLILRLARGTVVPLYGHSDTITAIASSPDGRYLATASNDGIARIWDASTGRAVTVVAGDGAGLTDVQFGPGDGLALTVDTPGFVRIWDTGIGEPVTQLRTPAQGQTIPRGFTEDGRQVSGVNLVTSAGAAATVTSASMLAWDARTGNLVRSVALPGITASTAPCSPGLQSVGEISALKMMSGGRCGLPPPPDLVLAVPVPRPLGLFPAMYNAVVELLALAMSPDGRYIAYARGRSVALEASDGRPVTTLRLAGVPAGLRFGASSDGLLIMTDMAIYLWSPLSGRPPLVVPQPSAPIDATLSESGAELAVAGAAGTVGVWSATDGRHIRTFRPAIDRSAPTAQPMPLRVAISPDGNTVASGISDGSVDFWDIASGKRIADTSVSSYYPIIELSPAQHGSELLAVIWPQVGTGVNAAGAAAVLDWDTGHVAATYQSPAPLLAPVDPGAALSADGNFVFAGALGLAPTAPAGIQAAYQLSSGQLMADLQTAAESGQDSYSEFPAQPWSPDGSQILAGTAIYACDSCGPLPSLQASAAARIAWSQPLSDSSDHPPAASPYGGTAYRSHDVSGGGPQPTELHT